MVLSPEPETIVDESRQIATQYTQPECPVSVFKHFPLLKSHILTLLSQDADISFKPSQDIAIENTAFVCPVSVLIQSQVTKSHILIVLQVKLNFSKYRQHRHQNNFIILHNKLVCKYALLMSDQLKFLCDDLCLYLCSKISSHEYYSVAITDRFLGSILAQLWTQLNRTKQY